MLICHGWSARRGENLATKPVGSWKLPVVTLAALARSIALRVLKEVWFAFVLIWFALETYLAQSYPPTRSLKQSKEEIIFATSRRLFPSVSFLMDSPERFSSENLWMSQSLHLLYTFQASSFDLFFSFTLKVSLFSLTDRCNSYSVVVLGTTGMRTSFSESSWNSWIFSTSETFSSSKTSNESIWFCCLFFILYARKECLLENNFFMALQ